jgi:formate-dependent nitrite reductase cytochrome c552 subunit
VNWNEEGHAGGGVHCRGGARRRCGCGGRGFVDAAQDDMKMLVCAQCHVEYYFAEPGNGLTFPRAQGTTPAAAVTATQMPTWQDCAPA